MKEFVLFPGRHHLLTNYQAQWLRRLLDGEVCNLDGTPADVSPDATVVFAVTSATHHGTRRNPVPFTQRALAIERFATLERLDVFVAAVADVAPTGRFAEVTLKHVASDSRNLIECTPGNCVVACSTPELIEMYEQAGFAVAGVELDATPTATRPGDLLSDCARGDRRWRTLAHPASVAVFDRYQLDELVAEVSADVMSSEDGSLTDTRDYQTYTAAFDEGSDRKWDQVRRWVQPGRVVDIGCAAGGLLARAAREPRLAESDLFGVELSRHLLAEANHRKAQGQFANPNTFFVAHNVLNGPVFAERTVDTTITVALTHEVHSYAPGGTAGRDQALQTFIRRVYDHTRPGGVWVCSDVCGPEQPDRQMTLRLRRDNGMTDAETVDSSAMSATALRAHLSALSTAGLFEQFIVDFARYAGHHIAAERSELFDDDQFVAWQVSARDAMEFMTRKDYTDNWVSECHETFCHWSWTRWQDELSSVGFGIGGPGAWRNDWLVEQRFEPTAQLADTDGNPVDWPTTHTLFAAVRATP